MCTTNIIEDASAHVPVQSEQIHLNFWPISEPIFLLFNDAEISVQNAFVAICDSFPTSLFFILPEYSEGELRVGQMMIVAERLYRVVLLSYGDEGLLVQSRLVKRLSSSARTLQ